MQSIVLAIVNPSVRPSGCLSVCLSVRLSVSHTLSLCQNDSSYTIMRSSLEDSPMTLVS